MLTVDLSALREALRLERLAADTLAACYARDADLAYGEAPCDLLNAATSAREAAEAAIHEARDATNRALDDMSMEIIRRS